MTLLVTVTEYMTLLVTVRECMTLLVTDERLLLGTPGPKVGPRRTRWYGLKGPKGRAAKGSKVGPQG